MRSNGVILFPEDSTRRAYICWRDTVALAGPTLVRILDPGTRWRTMNGITIGTALAELERDNGRGFAFNGFEWDLGGYVDGRGGALETLLGPRARLCARLGGRMEGLTEAELARVTGDQVVLTNDSIVYALRPFVEELCVAFT